MAIGELAKTLTELLAPALPYLLDSGRKADEKLGSEAWNKAADLWARLRPEVEAREATAAKS